MKLSAWVSVSDLIPHKKTIFDRFILAKFIYQSIFHKNNPGDVLLNLKKCGVNGIELLMSSNTKENDIQKVKDLLAQVKMQVFSIHQPLSSLFNISILEVTKLFKVAKALKALVIVLHINVIGNQIFDQDYIKALKNLENEYNIMIGIENSPKSYLSLFKSYSWKEKEFLSLMKKTGFCITFDTTHLAQTGKDIISFYKNNKDSIVNIHLSNYRKSFLNTRLLLTNDTHLPLKKGELPIKEFLQTLKEENYDGLITMEINGSLEELCQSANFCLLHF